MRTVTLFSRIWSAFEAEPDAIILRDHRCDWTWTRLLERAAGYRDMVGELPIASAVAVPVIVDRTGETIASILGILMSGHAFAPLSPNQPVERLQACVDALRAEHVLLMPENDEANKLRAGLEAKAIALPAGRKGVPERTAEPDWDTLLYILFTSGSTGTPKGVQVSFGNIENTMMWSRDIIDWHDNDVIGNVAPFFFDISMFDMFAAFYFDVTLGILSAPSNMAVTLQEIEAAEISSIFSAPLFFSQFVHTNSLNDDRLRNVRRILSGGDFFPPAHILAWLDARQQTEIWNVWGPTETSIVNTMHRVDGADRSLLANGQYPPVGRTHPRMPFVLLDESRQPVAPGVEGEICMIGDCVTLGYLNDPVRTEAAYFEYDGQPAFGTQDLGRMDDLGNLFMIGRMGSMVKVGGYRIELGEVESAATRIDGVRLAGAFVDDTVPELKQVQLAIEMAPDGSADIFAIKQRLRAMLPSYMVPKKIHVFDRLPRSPNGKINRSVLLKNVTGAKS
ncbi:MAG: AMP-binding protein [Pontixanthobacter sp.]